MSMLTKSTLTKFTKLATNLGSIVVKNPTGLRHVIGVALATSEDVLDPELDLRSLPAVGVWELTQAIGNARCELHLFQGVQAAIMPLEALALASLVRAKGYKIIFEFGTYKGVSTTQLALNAGPDGKVYTLDLPEDDPRHEMTIRASEEKALTDEKGKGSLVPADLVPRVHFLRQDSATFDPTPFESRIDFVFVDGAHSFEYVQNDTAKGWRMLRAGGTIAWHDCTPRHREVVRFLKSFKHRVSRIAGTALAFCVKP
jgi:predicted O-methyltransferase YrrM